jgi:hypothetical protein
VFPHVHAERVDGGVLTRANAVRQLAPRLPLVVAAEHHDDRADTQWMVGAEVLAHVGQREAAVLPLSEHADRRERPEQAIQRRWVHARRRGEVVHCGLAVSDRIGDPELRGDGERPRPLVPAHHPDQFDELRWRTVHGPGALIRAPYR